MASAIERYELIGNGHTGALICKNGSIDWLCWPRFDSGACFAALLGTPENGRWIIGPATPSTVKWHCREDTLILETEHITGCGSVRVIDFMSIANPGVGVVRIV